MSQIQEMDTALAEKQLELAGTGNVPLPSNVDLSTSVVLATDNNDIMEDTPTGANTTHCTNSILIQRAVPTAAAMLLVHDQSQKRTYRKHSRSLRTTLVDPPPRYVSSRRHGPGEYCIDIAKLTDDKDYS